MEKYQIIQVDESEISKKYQTGPLLGKVLSASNLEEDQIKELMDEDLQLHTSQATCVLKLKKRLLKAQEHHEKVFVGGDYDADGICSTAIMKRTLDLLHIENGYYIPDRFKEGYGLSAKTVELVKQKGYDLIITVDNGVKAHEAIAKAHEVGIEIIITDHHQIDEDIDVGLVVHPDYMEEEYRTLSGAGVALEISRNLIGDDEICTALAAVAAIADVMPLWKETRRIVQNGLNILRNGKPKSILSLVRKDSPINETTIGFQIVPKLNSVGRMNDISNVNTIIPFLLSEDINVINQFAKQLEEVNDARKQLSSSQSDIAMKMVQDETIEIIYDPSFHEGICGLIAGRIANQIHRPCLVLTKVDEVIKGSGRSIPSVNLFDLLKESPGIQAFGGHEQAIGISIQEDQFEAFKAYVKDKSEAVELDYTEEKDNAILINENALQFDAINELTKLSPLPKEIKKPVFALRNPELTLSMKRDKVTKYQMHTEHNAVDVVCFTWKGITQLDDVHTIVGTPSINRWRDKVTCQFEVEAVE